MLDVERYEWKVLDYLNRRKDETTYKKLKSISEVEDYYKAEVEFTEHYIGIDVDNTDFIYILKEEIDGIIF